MGVKSEPLISVIIPIYNMELYLEECVKSVLKQSYKNIEVILIDDGSTDNSSKIYGLLTEKDKRIKVICQKNGGLSVARNNGLKQAHGEYICFVDSDDWIDAKMLENLLKYLEKYDADIAVCTYVREYINGAVGKSFGKGLIIYEGMESIARGFVCDRSLSPIVMNKLYKKSVFQQGFLFPEGRNYEDIPLTVEITKQGGRVIFINEKYYHYRQRKNSIIHTATKKNSVDNWNARFDRYKELSFLNDEIKAALVRECITAIYKAWPYIWGSEKTYSDELERMELFLQENYRYIIEKHYSTDIRIMSRIGLKCKKSHMRLVYYMYHLQKLILKLMVKDKYMLFE